MATILEMKHICKSFFSNKVLDDVSFDLREGEVHTLLGENGAGKSTLMKILAGIYTKDSGVVELYGKKVEIPHPLRARQLGISMIFQELNVLDNLTVFENIFLGREETRFGLLNGKQQMERARSILALLGLDVDPHDPVSGLKISEKQMVEIAKSLSCDAKIIIMDEPTSSLSEKETETFFPLIEKLKRDLSISFIFISHRLNEIKRISDRISILRDGVNIATLDLKEVPFDEKSIVRQMVGRDIGSFYVSHKNSETKNKVSVEEPLLRVTDLTVKNQFHNVSFSVYPGEVLGIAGLLGAGRTEVLQTIMGLQAPDTGDLFIDGHKRIMRSPVEAMRLGIGYVPEDRRDFGLILDMTVKENITLSILRNLTKFLVVDRGKEYRIANSSVENLKVKVQSVDNKIKYLSGGNQQKVVIAKSLNTTPKIILLDEPTRGIDVNAKREIYSIISQLVEQNIAVIMVSSELPEIFGIADRILVMYEGVVAGDFKNVEANHGKIMNALVGVCNHEA